MISLFRASYCSWEIFPSANCCCACCSAVFKVSSFSFVLSISSASAFCFCCNNSTFVGSSFSRLFISFSCACVVFICEFTFLSEFCSPVVSPPISIVSPLMSRPLDKNYHLRLKFIHILLSWHFRPFIVVVIFFRKNIQDKTYCQKV